MNAVNSFNSSCVEERLGWATVSSSRACGSVKLMAKSRSRG
jgi:hypothetical protein